MLGVVNMLRDSAYVSAHAFGPLHFGSRMRQLKSRLDNCKLPFSLANSRHHLWILHTGPGVPNLITSQIDNLIESQPFGHLMRNEQHRCLPPESIHRLGEVLRCFLIEVASRLIKDQHFGPLE
jgi:hypothetical protein